MIIVEEGPKLLNLDVPKVGKIRFAAMARTEEISIPRKEYLIWRRSNPIEFLYDFIIKNKPPDIVANT